jgi:diguanylate cyclase (GGDEF)-like protein
MRRKRTPAQQAKGLLSDWAVVAVSALAGAAVVAGVFDPRGAGWFAALVALAVVGVLAWDGSARWRGERRERPFVDIEGPLLWTVAAWMLVRLGGEYTGHLTPIPAALVAWLVATRAPRIWLFPAVAAVALEVGLTAAGRQDAAELLLHLLLYAGSAWLLSVFAGSEAHRRRVSEAMARSRTEQEKEDRARDFGLLTAQAPSIRDLPGLSEIGERQTIGRLALDDLDTAFSLELELLRRALGLTTAAVLWLSPDGRELRLRGLSSRRQDLDRGPYPAGAGITGSLMRDVSELAVAPVKSGFAGVPYYDEHAGVGGVFAAAITSASGDGRMRGILVVDREATNRWTDDEREVLRLAARKLALDVDLGRRLKATDHERDLFARFVAVLGELNRVMGLEGVTRAAVDAVRALVPADFVAITLHDEAQSDAPVHRVVRAAGDGAERIEGLQFTDDEGMVGQAVRIGHPLPAGGAHKGTTPVFTGSERLPDMRSLWIVPLRRENEPALGTMVLAAHDPGAFEPAHRRDMLDLIATQMSIKFDLARSHEQIREMATTDGLTGLANHRVFQQAFDNMLNRARRQKGSVSLLLTDIDKFKSINDTYGHPFGDQVLKRVARILQGAARNVDLAARYGGEEFAVLLEDTGVEGAMQVAERIRSEVEALVLDFEGKPVRVTLSIGIASWAEDGEEKADLIDHADQGLYYAKEHGRNQVVAWRDIGGAGSKSAAAS